MKKKKRVSDKGSKGRSVKAGRPAAPSPQDVPLDLGKLEQITVSPLEVNLDPNNPRLAPEERGGTQDQLLDIMLRRFKIQEVAESIITRGYIPFDPLIAWRDGKAVTIREGNRRIAALKLLLDPQKAPPRFRERWASLSEEAKTVKDTLVAVDVRLVPSPDHNVVLAYLGFRHISGNLHWPAFEKATYIAELVEQHNWSYRDVARQIGSRSDGIERHYVAYRIVQQAKSNGAPGADYMQSSFGVLMRALNSPGTRVFLGVNYPAKPASSKNPVPKRKLANLSDFARWTFGTQEVPPVVEDSRQLTEWGKILESSDAVVYMRNASRPRFERALFKSAGETESVLDSLMAAADRLEESLPHVKQHKSNSHIHELVNRCTYFLAQILQHFPDIQQKYANELTNV